MKKKILSLVSLLLAAVMMFPAVVSATETTADHVIYYDGEKLNTVQLTIEGEGEKVWKSDDTSKAEVDNTGLVKAKAAGEVWIRAYDSSMENQLGSWKIKVVGRSCTSIAVDYSKAKVEYHSGEKFDTKDMIVTATYDNGDTKILSSSEYTYAPAGALKVADEKITVTYQEKTAEVPVTVKEVLPTKVEIVRPLNRSFTEGDKISDVEIKVTYTDGSTATLTSGFDQIPSATTALTTDITKLEVSYKGIPASITIEVKAKSTTGGTTGDTTTGTIKYEPADAIPKEYEVGEKLDLSKVTKFSLVKADGTVSNSISHTQIKTVLESKLTPFTTVSNDTDVTLTVTVGTDKYVLVLTGIKVVEGGDPNINDEDGPYEIRDVEMKKDKYDIGYEISLDDIKTVEVKWTKSGTAYTIAGKDLAGYAATPTIEVLDKDGNSKSRTYRDTIEEADVLTDSKGDKYVQLLLTFGDEDYQFDIGVLEHLHDYSILVETVAPNCTESGYDLYKCSLCSATQKTNLTPPHGHNLFLIERVPVSCEEGAYTLSKCLLCEEEVRRYTGKALGHDYGEWSVTSEPGFDTEGQKERSCSRCEKTETVILHPLNAAHTYRITVVAATCTEKGYVNYSCTGCDHEYNDKYTVALGHVMVNDTRSPTCVSEGYEGMVCEECGYMETTSTTPALGHNFVVISTVEAVSCVSAGYDNLECTRCKELTVGNIVTVPHTATAWVIDEPATETTEGSMHMDCAVCFSTYDRRPVPRLIPSEESGYVVEGTWLKNVPADITAAELIEAFAPEIGEVKIYSADGKELTGKQYVTAGCEVRLVQDDVVFDRLVVAENEAAGGRTITGRITSYGDNTAAVTVELYRDGESAVYRSDTVCGNDTTYTLTNVMPGIYQLKVSKANHVMRVYQITVE